MDNSNNNLTQGNILKQLITLSIPLILGNILQQLYNTIDAFVVGHFAGAEEFAAIGIAGTIMNLFLFILVGACTGLSVLFAKFYGTRNYDMLHKQHFTALFTGLTFSIILCIISLSGMSFILKLIQTPKELLSYTSLYLHWIFLSLPAAFLYNMYAAAFRASGDTLAALYILAAAILSNLLLDIFFVANLNMGIQGAAIATAITQLISAILCVLYLYKKHKEFLFTKNECKFDIALIITTIKCSITTAIHQASLYIGKMLVQGVINTGGTEIISAYTAATRIEGFANSFGDSSSAATSVIISQNYGVNNKKRIKKTFICSLGFAASLGLICAVIMFFTSSMTIKLLITGSGEIAFTNAVAYLKTISLFYILCFTGGTFTGFYNGTQNMLITLFGSLMQITLRVLLSWLLFANTGLTAIAIATGVGWLCANIFWLCYKIHMQKKFYHLR